MMSMLRGCALLVVGLGVALPAAAQQGPAVRNTGTAGVVPVRPEVQPGDTILLAEIRVVGKAAELGRIPGSATLVAPAALEIWRVPTMNDALRRVPGVAIREEEGLALRPNIGIRGLNPTRSTKVLLLEDGIPVVFAPYGDNAAYYHPPITRFERVEILRGSGQIAFGPQTVGGVINYITPSIPQGSAARVSVASGDRGLLDMNARGTMHFGRVGTLAAVSHRQAEGARENTGAQVNDVMLKATASLDARNAFTVRGNWYRERSNVTYSGLTEAEWAADPRSNPFANDSMKLDRWGVSATHALAFTPMIRLTTTAYASGVDRDWWRQSSNSAQRPNDASDPACGGMANLQTTCGNEGRLRSYRHFGVEPRLRVQYELLGLASELETGARFHIEEQDRRQVNGASPTARLAGPAEDPNSGLREDNLRQNTAWSGFAQQRVLLGHFTVTPGVRVEHVSYERTNRLNGATGTTELTQVIPGIGMTYEARPGLLLFGGAHRGFAPPRTEDVIDNGTGSSIDLDPELSWSYEAGFRGHAGPLNVEVTAFRMDFTNQIVAASVAGGTGAALTNAGRTLHQGAEVGIRLDAAPLLRTAGPYVETSLTWLPTARYDDERYAWIGTGGSDVGKVYAAQNAAGTRERVSVTGNRLPYAPEMTYTIAAGFHRPNGLDLRVERYAVAEQFADAANARVTVADGQQGVLPAYALWNVSASHRIARTGTRIFMNVRNLTDELYIADRTRGLLPGAPRAVQVGLRQEF
jgi:Fe(3+) dicitrate transport protein